MTDADNSLAAKLAAIRSAKAGSSPTPPTPPTPPVAPAPPVEFMADSRSENDALIDQAVDSVDIITAYNLWANKGTVDARGRTESIKVRCPNPAHPDNDPSAWINTDKGTYYCGGCEEGGDKLDIAAWHFGLPVPGYKDGKLFHDLRRKIAESQGYIFKPAFGGRTSVIAPTVEAGPEVAPPAPPVLSLVPELGPDGAIRESDPILAPVVDLPVGPVREDYDFDVELDWKSIVPAGTFLDTWMKQTTVDDVPEEYHFWNGLIAVASACGRDATLFDSRPVFSNLFVCFLGPTGSGKSKAKYLLDQLLDEALPYDAKDPFSKGMMRSNSSASGEALIWTFMKEMEDPARPKTSIFYPVKGLIDFNELSGLVGRASRMGNVIIPTLMQFYDMESTVETTSRTHGREKAYQPFACAVTTSQPRALRGLLTTTDAASGFLNRWFFASGKQKKRFAIGGVKVDIKPAVKPLQKILGWAGSAGELTWHQDAKELFENFFYTEIEPLRKHDETELLNRLDLLCKKLILIFSANMRHTQVEIEAVEQMMKLFPYLIECYAIPGAKVGSTLRQEVHEAVLKNMYEYQSKTGKASSLNEVRKRLRRRNYPDDLYSRVFDFMIKIEEIIEQPRTSTVGRPPGKDGTRYLIPDLAEAKDYITMSSVKTSDKKASSE